MFTFKSGCTVMDDETITGFVGDYEVVVSPPLGSGTFGSVHTATHRITGDDVCC